MKRKITSVALIGAMLFTGIIQSGCFGQFALTRAVYQWNDGVTSDKFIKTIVMYVLCIIPVYEVAALADFWVLNLIEFWTGSNPVGMDEGEQEEQLVEYRGKEYRIIATMNSFEVRALSLEEEPFFIEFCEEDMSWSYRHAQDYVLLSKIKEINPDRQAVVEVYTAEGSKEMTVQVPSGI